MGQYRILAYSAAKRDLAEIVDYLNTLSERAALRYYDLIVEKIGTLGEMPERIPLLRDPQLRLRGYRGLQAESYTVFFVIKGNDVQIRRILYGRRQYQTIL